MFNRILIKFLVLIGLAVLFYCCQNVKNGRLIYNEPQPENGFNFPYLLFIPDGMDSKKEQVLIVEPNNSGFASDDPEKHLEKAKRTASREYYIGNYVARKLGYPLLVPVFPRSETNWKIYTHAFDRDVAMQKGNALERIDLQLLAMTEDAEQLLATEGYRVKEQFLMTGFSASGTFVNRFTAVHPEKVMAAAAGGLNGLLILPVDSIGNQKLNFPLGVNNFPTLFGKTFDSLAFRNTPQLLFMGQLDENDAIPYQDGYDDDERELVYKLLGQEMLPLRWNSCREIYYQNNIKAEIVTFPGTGHEHPDSIKMKIVGFFEKHLPVDQSLAGE